MGIYSSVVEVCPVCLIPGFNPNTEKKIIKFCLILHSLNNLTQYHFQNVFQKNY